MTPCDLFCTAELSMGLQLRHAALVKARKRIMALVFTFGLVSVHTLFHALEISMVLNLTLGLIVILVHTLVEDLDGFIDLRYSL